jgi:hypothetical protein
MITEAEMNPQEYIKQLETELVHKKEVMNKLDEVITHFENLPKNSFTEDTWRIMTSAKEMLYGPDRNYVVQDPDLK